MINFLLLEDDPDEAKIILEILSAHHVKHIVNLQHMHEICSDENSFFDYAILDMNIPQSNTLLAPSEENGITAFRAFRENFPGTPILVLTGSHSNEHFREMIGHGTSCKIWGDMDIKTVDYLRKSELSLLENIIENVVCEVNRINDVTIHTDESILQSSSLSITDRRIFSIITNKLNGLKVKVSPISPGYSGAKIHLLEIQNEIGKALSKIIVKSGDSSKIEEESYNYNTYVASRLNHAKFPPKLDISKYGAKNVHSIYYRWLDNGKNKSLFDFIENENFQKDKLASCFNLTEEWRASGSIELKTIEEVRRLFLKDEICEQLVSTFGLKWINNFEKRRVPFKLSVCHCDFHGGNIFINPDENIFSLIDYGDIKNAPLSYDAVCLELGFFYNKDSKITHWFNFDLCKNWAIRDEYFSSSSHLSHLRPIREWAESLVEERELLATAYCYVLRQLKFKDVQQTKLKETLGILESIYARFNMI